GGETSRLETQARVEILKASIPIEEAIHSRKLLVLDGLVGPLTPVPSAVGLHRRLVPLHVASHTRLVTGLDVRSRVDARHVIERLKGAGVERVIRRRCPNS